MNCLVFWEDLQEITKFWQYAKSIIRGVVAIFVHKYLNNCTCYDKIVYIILFSSRWWVYWYKLFSVLGTLWNVKISTKRQVYNKGIFTILGIFSQYKILISLSFGTLQLTEPHLTGVIQTGVTFKWTCEALCLHQVHKIWQFDCIKLFSQSFKMFVPLSIYHMYVCTHAHTHTPLGHQRQWAHAPHQNRTCQTTYQHIKQSSLIMHLLEKLEINTSVTMHSFIPPSLQLASMNAQH